ncbi:MAG TPA: phytanoyl-CoA dioxygenase family protein [Chloroflexota bacterium]|nr:phytanoyl-CoA dioxygenase family protein [Chloroflexota bacterium]
MTATDARTAPTTAAQPPAAHFDDNLPAEHAPDLYRYTSVVEPLQGWEAVDEAQLDFYDHFGFLALEGAFTAEEVEGSKQGILNLVGGKYPGYRGIQFEAMARHAMAALSPEEKQDLVRKVSHYHDYDPFLRHMAYHPRLLELVRRIIGEEPALFESKALLKPPQIGREKPWHQDHAYWNLPLDARVVTAWIALDAATVENGCLFVIPGSHREGPVVHFRRRDWQICDAHVQVGRAAAAPLAPGGVLLFHSMLHHGTPANVSPQRRRALQFVYIPASVARISAQERLAVFGSEGKDVEC